MKLTFHALLLLSASTLAAAAQPSTRVVRQLSDSTFWPEGVAHDPRTGSYYLGSIRHGVVVRVDSLGGEKELWPRDSMRVGAVMGLRVDSVRRMLWVSTSGIPQFQGYRAADSALAALIQIRLDDGRIMHRWDFPVAPGGHALGDLEVAPNGDVYISDSLHPVIYKLKAGGTALEPFESPLFRSPQGIAITPDGRSLYLADYSRGLFHMDLATHTLTRVTEAPQSVTRGCDGLSWYRGSLIAVQNGASPARIVRFTLDATMLAIAGAEVIDRSTPVSDEPTNGVIVGDEFVYIANSQWEKYDETGQRKLGTRLVPPVLLAVKLR